MKGETMVNRALVVCVVLSSVSCAAVGERPINLNLAGGVALPLGSFGETASTGWHGLVGIGYSSRMQPIGLRLDAAHYRFEAEAVGPTRGITSATLNLSYRLPMTSSPLSPYLTAGAGAYRLECIGEPDCDNDTKFGWNAGLGTKIAALRLKWFLESRFQAVNAESGNVRFVPVTLGLTF
jgi:hypothetical protein